MKYPLLATDYDGTLAHDGAVDAATLAALRRGQTGGLRLMMVTGRELPELKQVFAHLDLFELVVAENGALLYEPAGGGEEVIAPGPPKELVDALVRQNVPISVGRTVIATVEPYEHIVLEEIRRLGLEWQIIFNKGSVMTLPSGVNKATGLKAALKKLGVSPMQVAGVGDAENDQAFLQMCGLSAAVANALPAVKSAVDIVTGGARGVGVAELIDRLLKDDVPAPRRTMESAQS
jgi:hydroxymethylpyrimidine pyrophosphatase-like HAD family hydrolase